MSLANDRIADITKVFFYKDPICWMSEVCNFTEIFLTRPGPLFLCSELSLTRGVYRLIQMDCAWNYNDIRFQ